jgi:cell division protein FtsW
MTEMVYGSVPSARGEPVISKWWRTIDRWTLSSIFILFAIGILLGFAASPPLAAKNGFEPFHYVQRQMMFGTFAFLIMLVTSLMTLKWIRRLSVMGFMVAFVATLLLPYFGTDFGKGSVRWYSLGFSSIQPSEFLKPGFVVVTAWLIAASQEINGPPGKMWSFFSCCHCRNLARATARFWAGLPDYICMGHYLFCGWGALDNSGWDGRCRGWGRHDCL